MEFFYLPLLLQGKSRLELSMQPLRTSHQKEMESREEEMDQLQSTMSKKVKSLENQLEDALEEKHSAVKVCFYKQCTVTNDCGFDLWVYYNLHVSQYSSSIIIN